MADITKKDTNDLQGVKENSADGFIFMVNQHLTVSQRATLLGLGNEKIDQIFNLERLRAVLDESRGYGLRLEYLRIPMSPEEQVAFFNTRQQDTIQRILKNELQADENASRLPATARLDVSLLQMLHSAMFHNLVPYNETGSETAWLRIHGGRIRATEVYVLSGDGAVVHMGTAPGAILDELDKLFNEWQRAYADAVAADREQILRTLAWFHHRLVSIMPFSDGNGRLARLIINQAARELCHQGVDADLIVDLPAYYKSLRAADDGDLSALIELLRAALV
ncbi:hypothetical protein GCM10027612_01800 [Microbispora bryophytorum subsp. camponoti]